MHDVSSLLLEAVANSAEAGAGHISLQVRFREGEIEARIEDDGYGSVVSNPFREGITTKGEGRGRGLHIIRERTGGRCRLTRGEGITVLEFSAEDDGSFDRLDEALLPLFNLDKSITVTIEKGGRAFTVSRALLTERDAVPDRAAGIRRFRSLLKALEKGETNG